MRSIDDTGRTSVRLHRGAGAGSAGGPACVQFDDTGCTVSNSTVVAAQPVQRSSRTNSAVVLFGGYTRNPSTGVGWQVAAS